MGIAQAKTPCENVRNGGTIQTIKNLCNASLASCSDIPAEKRRTCEATPAAVAKEFINQKIGCAKGVFKSAADLTKFVMDIAKFSLMYQWNTVKSGVQVAYQAVTDPAEFSRQVQQETAKNREALQARVMTMNQLAAYVAREFEVSRQQNGLFGATSDLVKSVSGPLFQKITQTVGDFVSANVHKFECYNQKYQSEMLCNVMGDFLIPPAGIIALLKGGGKALLRQFPKMANATREVSQKIAADLRSKSAGSAARKAAAPGAEFRNGVVPTADPSVVASFKEKFGGEAGAFYRGIRVPKGTEMNEYYVRSDGLGSMISTKPDDAIHYGQRPAGLQSTKLNSDDDIILISYELKPVHIQEDTYGTLEHVFIHPDVNLKSTNIGYRSIRVPASELEDPEKAKKYIEQLRRASGP